LAAPKGNKFWQARSSHGRDPIFKTSEDLWESCLEYFEWNHENPLEEAIVYQGELNADQAKPLMRAMTIDGLCTFLDISRACWDLYCGREDYLGVTKRAEQIMRTQKFEGASAGLLNPNIIARDLGLSDKKEHSGSMTVTELTHEQWLESLK